MLHVIKEAKRTTQKNPQRTPRGDKEALGDKQKRRGGGKYIKLNPIIRGMNITLNKVRPSKSKLNSKALIMEKKERHQNHLVSTS